MALILNIESATTVCSVCVSEGNTILALREVEGEYRHAEKLAVFVQEAMKEACKRMDDLNAVAVSLGPGSYTGLRIGTSLGKGICYGLKLPLLAVPTLKQMCVHPKVMSALRDSPDAVLAPMLDARRMEVYNAVYAAGLEELVSVRALVLEEGLFNGFLQERPVLFFGNGSAKFKAVECSDNAIFLDDISLSASQMALHAEQMFEKGEFVDLAYFEPRYLKEFLATQPKRLL